MRLARAAAINAVAFCGMSTAAYAHAFAQRYDLPLPLSYWLAGAGAAVALSFLVSGFVLHRAATEDSGGDPDNISAPWPPWLRSTVRMLAVALFGLLIVAGFAGPQDEPQDNILPVAVWVLWWVGLTCVVAVLGDVWRSLNPLRIIAEWSGTIASRAGLGWSNPPLTLPAAIGVWPAVALFVCFAWAELVWTSNGVPAKLAQAVLLYSALNLAAMAAFGIDQWLERGDAFARFFALVGRFAPFDLVRWQRRKFSGSFVAAPARTPSEAFFVLVVLATVSFDGLKETPFWGELTGGAMDALYRSGIVTAIGNVAAETIIRSAGLLVLPLLMLAAYLLTCLAMTRMLLSSREQPCRFSDLALAFAPSLMPIAVGYHVAHYFSYLLIQGQWIIPAASDPFGLGWNLFGTRGYQPDIAIVGAATVWWVAVIAIVAGHVAAVVVAHQAALRLFVSPRLAIASQYPMAALMVGYTMLSLWILAQPIVSH